MSRYDFETAGDAVVVLLQEAPAFEALTKVVLIRDLAGRLRLAWEPAATVEPDRLALEQRLADELGGWFHGPILSTLAPAPDERRIAHEIVQSGRPWPLLRAEVVDPRTSARVSVAGAWSQISRRLAKETWLDAPPSRPPWPLVRGAPAIVAFHSFKGGVGRSTALAVVAWQLAKAGKRVVCVDLDLESPGLDRVFNVDIDRGVLDFLITSHATGAARIEDCVVPVEVHGVDIDLVPAGWVDRGYVEKLGRLDFLSSFGQENPTERALREMLKQLRSRRPDYILVDNRSGLSDLAGITVASLAHVDVLVARGNRQGAMGLDVVASLLAPRRRSEDRRVVVVHSMAPLGLDSPTSVAEQAALRVASWDAFSTSFYAEGDAPAVDDPTAPHHPQVVPELDEIKRVETIASFAESTLLHDRFASLTSRIEELAAPEEGA